MQASICIIIAVCVLGQHYAAADHDDRQDVLLERLSDFSSIVDGFNTGSSDPFLFDDDSSLRSNRGGDLLLAETSAFDRSEWMIRQITMMASNLPPLSDRHLTIVMQTIEILMIRVVETITVVRPRPGRRPTAPFLIAAEKTERSEWFVQMIWFLATNLPEIRQQHVNVVMQTIEVLTVRVIETITLVKTEQQQRKGIVVHPPAVQKFRI